MIDDYHEFHESREELKETHSEPKICPITDRQNCQWHLIVMHREEWGLEFDFVCRKQTAKYEENQCPLEFNICEKCDKPVHEDDTVWLNCETLEAATPPNPKAVPLHVGCAPAQRRGSGKANNA